MTFFNLKSHHTTVGTEIGAGMTTFIAMLYIIPVNASIMSASGMPYDALVTATALMTIFASLLNGFWSNTPIAMSVGMGLNAYFSFGLVKGMGIPWQSALGIVFLSGILYVLISMTPIRRWMIETIPLDIKHAVSAGIGAFIAFIGLEQSKMVVADSTTLVTIGDFKDPHVLLALLGLMLALYFTLKRYKSALILSIVVTTLVGWTVGVEKLPEHFLSMPASVAPIAFKLDIASAFSLTLFPVVLIFLITDLFDTLGTLTGVGMRANLFEKKDSPALQKTIEADAVATVFSGLAGVTSTTAFIESAAGVEEGGRTGLSAVTVALMFVLTLFFLPFFKAIPSNAVYPILIVIGVMMFSELQHLDYRDNAVKFSAFFIVLGMPLTYSITNGLLLGAVVFSFVKIVEGKYREIGMAMSILSLAALVVFFVL